MASDNQSDSQGDTASSSLVEDSLNISFEDITYEVRNGIFSRGEKHYTSCGRKAIIVLVDLDGLGFASAIQYHADENFLIVGLNSRKTVLAGLSGTFNAGELAVIMGQSGAGKSSLMDVLAGYSQPTSGNVLVNGRVRNKKSFRRRSCYILQDDKVQDMLTIEESLKVAAELKLGNHVSKEQKQRRIKEVIESLELMPARNTLAGHLSGGEKKRLAIGLELVSDPLVMFLDEPTSGLDSSMSSKMVALLHSLARQGRTVVATIHQPSAALLQLVDRLYAVVGGRCAYMGSVSMLYPFLDEMQLTCPQYHNIVDFLIEKCGDDKIASVLVQNTQNGKQMQWIANIPNNTDENVTLPHVTQQDIFLTTLPPPKEDPTNKILSKLKSTYTTSFWKQFTILTKRSLLSYWRNPQFTLMVTGIHCAMALFVGFLFFKVGEDAKYARDNFNCLFFGLMFLMFTAFSAVTVTYPEQFPVVRREHFNQWYMTGAYYFSTLVSTLPTQTICTLSYATIIYFLTGQPHDFIRFSIYCWTLMLVSYVALCMGLLNGSIFNVKNGVVFGPFFIMPFVIFSGFFLLYSDAPVFFHWLFHINFLKHGLVALSISVFGMDRAKMKCSDTICWYIYPKQVLIEREIINEPLWLALVSLIIVSVVVNISTYFVLKIRLRSQLKW